VRVNNATRVDIEVDDISDPNFGQSILDVDGVTTWQSAGTGVIWAKGETYIKAHTILGSNYGLWAKGDNDGATDANLWMECDFLKSGPGSAAYWSGGVTANWRTWLKCQEIECVAVEGVSGAVNWLGGGRHYVEAQKITAPGNVFFVQGAGGFDPSVWLNAQKLSGGGSVAQKLLTVASGVLHATVMHFEDNGFAAGAINVTGGELNLTGGLAKILNGPGIIQSGGIARISGLRMDTANTNNVANVPVSVSSAGLTLRNCVLVAPALADSVKGDAARTITNYGSVANKAKNANVTVNVAALIVDGRKKS